jgi:hypothetical protein
MRSRPPSSGDETGDVDANDRPSHKRSRPQRKVPATPLWRRARRFSAVLCGVLALELVAATLTSHHFSVAHVGLEGEAETPTESLDPVRAGVVGYNWLRLPRNWAEQKAESIPTVASAQLQRVWTWPPSAKLVVTERRPFARVGAGNDWWVVDESGVPFRAARKADDNLYAVTGPQLQPKIGQALPADDWQPVVQFAAALSDDERTGGGWNLRRVYFDKHGFASLRLTGGRDDETLVQLGADNWPEKLKTARWALADFASSGKHAATLNLISSSVTTWTPRATPKAETSDTNSENETQDEDRTSSEATPAA